MPDRPLRMMQDILLPRFRCGSPPQRNGRSAPASCPMVASARYDGISGHYESDLKKMVAIQGLRWPLECGRDRNIGDGRIDNHGVDTERRIRYPDPDAGLASAATELGGTVYVSAVANGSFTITHANSATAGRTFLYAVLG